MMFTSNFPAYHVPGFMVTHGNKEGADHLVFPQKEKKQYL